MAPSSSRRPATTPEVDLVHSPPTTLLVPRPRALRLVELCELAEMTPSVSSGDGYFAGLVRGADPGSPSDGAKAAGAKKSGAGESDGGRDRALATQMALLLYLGEYGHARHLWRRHRGDNDGNAGNDSASGDHPQLEMLWNAAKYICLWSTGGIHSLASSRLSSSDGSSAGSGMQVEEENDGGNLPFSTLALRALKSCQNSGMEPLATYSRELAGVFRSRFNRGLHRHFDKLDPGEFRLRMDLSDGNGGKSHDGERVWEAFGWREEGGYLISDVDAISDDEGEESFMATAEEEEDRIGKLTDIIMFLEGRTNA